MSKNASTTTQSRTSNAAGTGRKGPRPIQTVAQIRATLLQSAMLKEIRKVDKKLESAEKKRRVAHLRANEATTTIAQYTAIRNELAAEIL